MNDHFCMTGQRSNWILFLFICLGCATCTMSSHEGNPLPDGARYYFSLFGDSRDGNHVYSALQNRSVLEKKPLFAVHLGDMISNHNSFEQWPSFISLTEKYFDSKIFHPIIGNHDVQDTNSLITFLASFPEFPKKGYHAKILGDCFCLFLNSEDLELSPGTVGSTQLAWLEDQLNSVAFQEAKFRLVFVHRPPFPQNHHIDEPLEPADQLHDLFTKYQVTAVISGHEHSFSKVEKQGVTYIISGGAGSPLYTRAGADSAFYHYLQVSYLGSSLLFRVIDFFGEIRDEFSIDLD